jgi:5-methylcytosine-specific restriction protein A
LGAAARGQGKVRTGDRVKITDADVKKFYDSHGWRCTRKAKLIKDTLCQACLMSQVITPAIEVHHLKPIRLFWDDRFNEKFLLSLCMSCHSIMEAEIRGQARGASGPSR